jgi:hypothetical protein
MQDPWPHHQQAAMFTEIQREACHILKCIYNAALVTMLNSTPSDVRGAFGYKALLELLLAPSSSGAIKIANLSETEVRS